MIINCEAAVCIPSQSHRFVRAKVGVGRDVVREAYFLVVVRANQRDRFHLAKSNVKILRASFEFQTPNKYVMLRDCNENLLQALKSLVRKIIDSQGPIPKLPTVERIYSMKPSQASLSSIGTSKADLKKLTNKCLKAIDLSSLKKIPSDIWALKNLSTLKLTECKMKRIPREMHHLNQSLSCLVLSRNEIDEIPMWFCRRMQNLKTLDLSWNRLRSIPFEVILLRACKSFNFSNNSISTLPNIFSAKILSATVYDKIDLSHNRLCYIHASETKLSNELASSLHCEIDFSHNHFSHDLDLAPQLDQRVLRQSNDNSLFSLALEGVITEQRLLLKMFVDTFTPKPIYQEMQRRIFLCYRCQKLRLRLGRYVVDHVEHFPVHNFAGRLTHDFSGNLKVLYLYCKLCSQSMDSGVQ